MLAIAALLAIAAVVRAVLLPLLLPLSSKSGVQHVHMMETFDGVPIVNLVSNVNVAADGTIISAGHAATSTANFVAPSSFRSLSAIEAVTAAAKALGYSTANLGSLKFANGKITGANFALQDIRASKKFYLTEDGQLESVWDLEIQHAKDWNNVFVSANSGTILGATSFMSDFVVMNVVPFNKDSILAGQVLLSDPSDKIASPSGWFNAAVNGEYTSVGNNVKSVQANKLTSSRNGGKFDYVYDMTKDPASSIPAAVSQVHYLTNKYHDVLYKYGFTEAAGNFQTNNFGKGGAGGDAILASIQEASGTNNANFATPPMVRLRDGDMDNGVVTHELTHGLSNRLTGGPGNANCLSSSESGGMGEGWSDTVAWWATMDSSMTRTTDRATGAYVLDKSVGIRTYPYSTSLTTNKHKYSELKTTTEVHDVGEIWSTMLFEVYWNMVDAAGFEPDVTNVASQAGNIRFLQNLVDGLKLQPCNPTFISARDAILSADVQNNGGKFKCAIWKGFAKRGLGFGATSTKADVTALPTGC
ncbi:Fungalysin metallopeptidase-domain-containing protein [Chytridium lagenaria]|nr:Fungalysin metallopeptidase-domain-containing protein [Chytridium lagenaria]